MITGAYPLDWDNEYKKIFNNDTTISGVIHSSSIYKGLVETNHEVFHISAVCIGHYPITSNVKKVFPVKYSNNYFGVGYKNNILTFQKSKEKAILKCFQNDFSVKPNDQLNIVVGDCHEPFIKSALKIKKKHKNSKIVLVCLDVPNFVISSSKNIILRFLKKISVLRLKKLIKKVDGYVLLSEKMAEIMKIEKPYFVSPFICNIHQYDKIEKIQFEKKTIGYFGVLSKQYDIDLLLDAFDLIKDAELILGGSGDCVDAIKRKAILNENIKYLGILSREDALKMQKSVDVLVNPRLPGKEYTDLSFPSKTSSYLLSGNKFVCYSMPNFPCEISNMIFEPKGLGKKDLAKTIQNALKSNKSKVDFSYFQKHSEETFANELDQFFKRLSRK